MVWIPSALHEVRQKLDQGAAPTVIVRKLLSWFHSERRGSRVVSSIHAALRELDMTTTPNFEDAWIDGELAFSYASPRSAAALEARPATEPPPVPSEHPVALSTEASDDGISPLSASFVSSEATLLVEVVPPPAPVSPAPAPEVSALHARHDPVLRLGKLAAANKKPMAVNLDTPLNEAVSLMMRHDFSQLPVLNGPFRLEGAVTWKSIVRSYTLRTDAPVKVRDCLDYAPVNKPDDSIFEALDHIMSHGFTLVQNRGFVRGLVTLSDVTSEFRGSLEPFALIGEIERHLRQLLDRRLTAEVLRSALEPGDPRDIHSAAELSFGQYRRLLEQESVWQLCGLRVDRKQFVKDLEAIRQLRNEIMHFQSEAVSDEDLRNTRGFAVFLREIVV